MADDLQGRIARALAGANYVEGPNAEPLFRDEAADLLPIVAEEVRKAKAEAWAEGWDHRNTPDGYAWDGEQDVPLVSSRYDNPYIETGGSDEHR